MSAIDDVRDDLREMRAEMREGFAGLRSDLGATRESLASHVTEDRLRLGALETRMGPLSKDETTPDGFTLKTRGISPPSLRAAAQWGAALALFGGPVVAVIGGLLGFAPERVEAAVKGLQAVTPPPAVLRVDAALPAPEPVAPAGPSVQPAEPQE